MPTRRRRPILPGPIGHAHALRLALVGCVVLATAHALYYWPEVIDDAYIVFRYAKNYVLGYGMAFNPGGPQVEGFSTLTWFWLSVLALRLGAHDLLTWAKVVGIVLHALTVLGVFKIATWASASPRAGLLAALLYALNPFAAYHAVAGLETPLATALVVAVVIAVTRLDTQPRVALGGLLLTLPLLLATRPESFGYAAAILVAGWVYHRNDHATVRRLALGAIVAVAVQATLMTWRRMTFGALFPNTAAAKAGGFLQHALGLHYTTRYFDALPIPTDVALYVLCSIAILLRPTRRDLVLVTPVVSAVVFATVVGGDWTHSFRFLVPATPFVCALVARGSIAAFEARRWPIAVAQTARLTVAVLLVLTAMQLAMLDHERVYPNGFSRGWKPLMWPAWIAGRVTRGYEARLPGVTRWLLEHVSSDGTVATGDIGFPAWTTNERIIDLVGLTDRNLARIVPAGDQSGFTRYLERMNPDVVVMQTSDGRPVGDYDRLLAGSGVLSRYRQIASVPSYGSRTEADLSVRFGAALDSLPDSVLARYDRALIWNPGVPDLRTWRDEFARRHLR